MANRKPFSYPRFQAFDGNGDPLSGGTAEFFDAGTTNNRTVYSDPELNTATPNPVTLNARGEPESGGGTPIDIYFDSSAYKIVLKDSDGNTVWTIDNFIQDDLSDISEPKDPKDATDTGTDTFEGILNRDPNSGEEFDLDFQSANTTTTPTFENTGGSLGALTIKTRDGSALWTGALEGIHTLKYDGTDYILLDPYFGQNLSTSGTPTFSTVDTGDGGKNIGGLGDDTAPINSDLFANTLSELQGKVTSRYSTTDTLYLRGRDSVGDGGEGHFRWDSSNLSTEVGNDEVTAGEGDGGIYVAPDSDKTGASGAWVRQFNGAINYDWYGTTYSSALPAIASSEQSHNVTFGDQVYTVDSAVIVTDVPLLLQGIGWVEDESGNEAGTILDATGSSPATILTFTSSATGGSPWLTKCEVSRLLLRHNGTGAALTFDEVIRTLVEEIRIDCLDAGAVGIKYTNNSFFARLVRSNIYNFTDTGVLFDGTGSEHVIEDCHIKANNDSALTGVETRRSGTIIRHGQIDVNRSDDTGVGILFNNKSGGTVLGGYVVGTLCEADIAVKVTGDSFEFVGVKLHDLRFSLGVVTKGVVFDRAINCELIDPQIGAATGGGTLVEFGSNATRCGVIGDYNAAQAPMIVDNGAAQCYKIVKGEITATQRDSVTTDSNLTVICENIQGLGRTRHNGVAWDAYQLTIADDAADSVTPPANFGEVSFAVNAPNKQGSFEYNVGAGSMAEFYSGAALDVIATDGTLSGTTGTDGNVTVRADSTSGKIYVENRHGSERKINVYFRASN